MGKIFFENQTQNDPICNYDKLRLNFKIIPQILVTQNSFCFEPKPNKEEHLKHTHKITKRNQGLPGEMAALSLGQGTYYKPGASSAKK